MPSAPSPRFILVGHCGPDMYMLRAAVSRLVPGAATAVADDADDLEAELSRASVLLINRVLDGDFGTSSGIELIARLAKAENRPAMLLISNYPEAQQQAIAAGALPGFGKAELYNPRTAELLREAAASNSMR